MPQPPQPPQWVASVGGTIAELAFKEGELVMATLTAAAMGDPPEPGNEIPVRLRFAGETRQARVVSIIGRRLGVKSTQP